MSAYDTAVLADSPVCYVKLDETSGTVAHELGSNAVNWTYSTGVTLNAGSIAAGIPGSAVGGTSGIAAMLGSVPAAFTTYAGLTLEFWIYLPNTTLSASPCACYTTEGISVQVSSDQLTPTVAGASRTGYTYTIGAHHVVTTVDVSGNWHFYVDGVSQSNGTGSDLNPCDGNPCIGGTNFIGFGWFNTTGAGVKMAAAAVYIGALSGTRVLAHYNAGLGVISARADGHTAVTVSGHSVYTIPGYGSAEADGVTTVAVTATVSGVFNTSAVSNGATAVVISPTGSLTVSAEADGVTTVTAGYAASYAVSLESDGATRVALLYTPDLFSDDDDGGYDPNAPVPVTTAPPITLGMDLRGACSLVPPALEPG